MRSSRWGLIRYHRPERRWPADVPGLSWGYESRQPSGAVQGRPADPPPEITLGRVVGDTEVMYIPAHFAADAATLAGLLDGLAAADLVTLTPRGLVATTLPLLHEPDGGEHGRLVGHLARTNDQWRHTEHEAMVIVRGGDGYISPTWYPSKAEHGRVVPTWNYLTAHVYGTLVSHDDPAWLADLVDRLTRRHEGQLAQRTGGEPWSASDAPEAYLRGQLRAIVGVELVITRIEAKAKLSQNRPDADIDGVVSGLERAGRHDLAATVAAARPGRAVT